MGKKGHRRGKRVPIQTQKDGDNVPLEITLLLSGWVAALQRRNSINVPTQNALLAALQSFSDSLTGLERVLCVLRPALQEIELTPEDTQIVPHPARLQHSPAAGDLDVPPPSPVAAARVLRLVGELSA